MSRQAAVLTMEELNKDLRSLQKQTKETKYSSMMQLLRLALSGQQVKNKNSETGTFFFFFFFWRAIFSLITRYRYLDILWELTSVSVMSACTDIQQFWKKELLKVSDRQKLSKHEYAGTKSEVRKSSGPAVGSVGKVVGFGQNWDFMCNLLLQSSKTNFTKVYKIRA